MKPKLPLGALTFTRWDDDDDVEAAARPSADRLELERNDPEDPTRRYWRHGPQPHPDEPH